jgi:hypothetical protein
MKAAIILFSALVSLAAFADTRTVLEIRDTNGPGQLTQDIVVKSDGTVTRQGWNTQPQVVEVLDDNKMDNILAEIGALDPAAKLEQVNPAQHPNPGGFSRVYRAWNSEGTEIDLYRNVSGVDYALPGNEGSALVLFLSHFVGVGGGSSSVGSSF